MGVLPIGVRHQVGEHRPGVPARDAARIGSARALAVAAVEEHLVLEVVGFATAPLTVSMRARA